MNTKFLDSKSILVVATVFAISSILFSGVALAEVASPKKQMTFGIGTDGIICNDGFFKVIRASSDTPTCVKLSSVSKLVEKGWAKPVDSQIVEQHKQLDVTDSGNVKKIAVVKEPSKPGIYVSSPSALSYNFVFEACAGAQTIEFPEVIVTSDTAVKHVTLAKSISANQCQISAVSIPASNPDSISADIANEGLLANRISELQMKMDSLKQSLAEEKSKLDVLLDEKQAGDFAKRYADRVDKIVTLRSELNQVREVLNNHLFALHLKPTYKVSDLQPSKSFAGTPIGDVLVNTLSVMEGLVTQGSYDVAFEMCAGSELVRIPLVTVKSDSESKTVRLSDKIIPNSCQVSGTKIMAEDPQSITVTIGESGEKSTRATDLEKRIQDISAAIDIEKKALRDLTHNPQRPADFNEQVLEISHKIIDLRDELNQEKAELYLLLSKSTE